MKIEVQVASKSGMRRGAFIALALAGCWPVHAQWRPPLSGTVLDAQGQPAPNARVLACTAVGSGGDDCALGSEARTGADGAFAIPPGEGREAMCLLGPSRPLVGTTWLIASDGARCAAATVSSGDAPRPLELRLARAGNAPSSTTSADAFRQLSARCSTP